MTRKSPRERRDDPKRGVMNALLRMETEAKDAGFDLTRSMIAETANVARSAVSAWFAGKQLPRPKQLDALAGALSLGDEVKKSLYRRELFEAADVKLPAPPPLERARERSAAISIGVVAYDEVGIDAFFEDVARAFGDFCGFVVNVKRVPFADLANAIATGDVDIGAGLWETPDRLLSLRFIGMPLEMGMNALAFATAERAIPLQNDFYDVDAIEPIMNEGQASYRFAQHVLGISKHRILSCEYNVDAFASRFVRSFEEWAADHQRPIPVLLSDEAMCLKVHNRLLSDMVASSPDFLGRAGLPLLLMDAGREAANSRQASEGGGPLKAGARQWGRGGNLIAAHPRYNISLCVKRLPRDEWFPYIEDAWRIFIRGNRDFLVSKYADLCQNLAGLVKEAKEVLNRAATATDSEPKEAASHLAERWRDVVRDWLFDNELRDFHDEQTWNRILAEVKEHLPDELRAETKAEVRQ